MKSLHRRVCDAVAAGRYRVSLHALERLEERQIELWQIEAGTAQGRLLTSRPKTQPNPSIVIEFELSDGTLVAAVWAWLPTPEQAKLVTAYFPLSGET
ncbi:MAG TPA: DUF4258 domain-containing protein, partial [Planctomycetaceae bacterium]|nr:DUF4258 domain-containing protein [Planctomycetaceae bacterium]